MHGPSFLFDRAALARYRGRARRIGPADFLHHWAATEINERLTAVNRAFAEAAAVGPFADVWTGLLAAPGRRWRGVADDDVIDLRPGSCDLVVHGLGLHLSNDPVGQVIQCRRALRPDGLFIAALFGGETLSELRAALGEAEVAVTGGLSPRVAPMGEIRDLGGLMQRAGLALPVADSLRLTVSYASVLALMRDLRAMAEANCLADRLRRPTRSALFAAAETVYPRTSEGRVAATFEVIFLTGWAPAEGQQKPLRPGSATGRLAEALGTVERRASGPPGGFDLPEAED